VSNTEWHNIVVRNKAAEICEKYAKKGDKMYVEGRLKNRQWQGEDGQTRYSTEIQVTDFTFLTAKPEAVDGAMAGQRSSAAQVHSRPAATQTTAPVDQEDDLPF